jgi:hypothetical protein
VAIKEDGGLAGSFERLGVDERVEICGNDFNFLETGRAKMVGYPPSRALDVRFAFGFGADAGDSQEFAEFRQMGIAITFY